MKNDRFFLSVVISRVVIVSVVISFLNILLFVVKFH